MRSSRRPRVSHRDRTDCRRNSTGSSLPSLGRWRAGRKNVLGVGSEFVVFEFSVVRHDGINLPRFASMGVVSSARTSARRSAQEGAKESPYLGWKVGQAKNVFGREGGLQTETSHTGLRRAISLCPCEVDVEPGPPTATPLPITPEPNVCRRADLRLFVTYSQILRSCAGAAATLHCA